MRVIRDPDELTEYVDMIHRNRFTLGFVPTMGALHEGHLSLARRSVLVHDRTIVSVYVNPLQFGADEDLERYPRDLDADVALCDTVNVGVVFAPSVRDMQPPDCSTSVCVRGVSEVWEGAQRGPDHFDGVTTIVARLLNLVQPHRVYFGQKDYQQVVVVRRMVRDLAVPVDVVVCPIVRDADGLALSSRNRYLSPEDRQEALRLPRALEAAEQVVQDGETNGDRLRAMLAELLVSPRDDVVMDYSDVVHQETLRPLDVIEGEAVLLAALRVGKTRLIDNRMVSSASASGGGE